MKNSLILLVALLTLAATAMAGEVVGGRAAAYVRTPVGVRALGLGGSYVSLADDATSLYWNVAGLARVSGPILQATHSTMDLDRQHSLLCAALPLAGGRLVLGAMWDRFAVDGIQGRDSAGELTAELSDRENLIAGGLGMPFGAFALGGGVRYYQQGLADYKADGLGLDCGARFGAALWRLQLELGASVTDLGAALSWDTPGGQEDKIPAMMRLGGAAAVPIGTMQLLVSAAMHSIQDEDPFFSVGAEYSLVKALQLRAGLYDDRYAAGATIAVGRVAVGVALAEDVIMDETSITVGLDLRR